MAMGNNAPNNSCKACNAPLADLVRECPACGKPIDSATMLRLATALVDAREERAVMMPKLRDVFSGGPSISPAARAHFARSGAAGRMAALRAVQASGDSSEFPTAVLESYYKKSPADLRVEIIRTLGAAGSEASVQVLQRILEDEKDERVRGVFRQKLDDGQVDDITFPSLEVSPLAKAKKQPTTFEREIEGMEGLPEPERPVSNPPPSIVAPEPAPVSAADEAEGTTDEISILDDGLVDASPDDEDPTLEMQPEHLKPGPAGPPAPPKAPPAGPPKSPPPGPPAPPKPAPAGPPGLPPQAQPPVEPAAKAEPPAKVALPGGPDVPELPRQPSLEQLSAKEPHPVASPLPEKAPARSRGCLMLAVGLLVGAVVGGAACLVVFLALVLPAPSTPQDVAPSAVGPGDVEPGGEPATVAEKPAVKPVTKPAAEPVKLSFTVEASSQHKKYPAKNLVDGDVTTVWQEDRKTKAENKTLTFTFEKPVTVMRIGAVVGYDDTDKGKGDLWPLNNRLKSALVEFPDGTKTVVDFEDERGMQLRDVESPGPVTGLTLTVLECYRGSWFRDNAIAEIEIWGAP